MHFKGNIQKFYSDDDFFHLRKHMSELVEHNVEYYLSQNDSKNLRILEVGPSGAYDNNTPYPEFDTSSKIKYLCNQYDHTYCSLDLDPNSGCDFSCDVAFLSSLNQKFDAIILISVLEHVPLLHKVPEELHKSLNENGIVFINTPFMFKVHGPIPDCWRISRYGYEALFSKYFDLSFSSWPVDQLGKNAFPLSINVIGAKK